MRVCACMHVCVSCSVAHACVCVHACMYVCVWGTLLKASMNGLSCFVNLVLYVRICACFIPCRCIVQYAVVEMRCSCVMLQTAQSMILFVLCLVIIGVLEVTQPSLL